MIVTVKNNFMYENKCILSYYISIIFHHKIDCVIDLFNPDTMAYMIFYFILLLFSHPIKIH